MLSSAIERQGALEARLSQLGADLAEIGAAGADTHALVASLQNEVAAIADAVHALGGEVGSDQVDEAYVVDWSRLDRATAEVEWTRLYEWLDDLLVPRYGVTVTQLRPCWPHHPEVREELSWLHTCWLAAYRSPSATPGAGAEWHVRWLPAALDRIADHTRRSGCTMGQHRGYALPDELRQVPDAALSQRPLWLDDGREADLRNREDNSSTT